MPTTKADHPRIVKLFNSGWSYEQLGQEYQVSRQRIQQIVCKYEHREGIKSFFVIQDENKRKHPEKLIKKYLDVKLLPKETAILKDVYGDEAVSVMGRTWASRRMMDRIKYSNEFLIDQLKSLAEKLNVDHVSIKTAGEHFSYPVYLKRFGTWKRACELAGLKTSRNAFKQKPQFSKQKIKNILKPLIASQEISAATTVEEYQKIYKKHGGKIPSSETIRNFFGTWMNFIREIFKPVDLLSLV